MFQGVHETICFGPAATGWSAGEAPLNQIVFIGRDLNRRVRARGRAGELRLPLRLGRAWRRCIWRWDTWPCAPPSPTCTSPLPFPPLPPLTGAGRGPAQLRLDAPARGLDGAPRCAHQPPLLCQLRHWRQAVGAARDCLRAGAVHGDQPQAAKGDAAAQERQRGGGGNRSTGVSCVLDMPATKCRGRGYPPILLTPAPKGPRSRPGAPPGPSCPPTMLHCPDRSRTLQLLHHNLTIRPCRAAVHALLSRPPAACWPPVPSPALPSPFCSPYLPCPGLPTGRRTHWAPHLLALPRMPLLPCAVTHPLAPRQPQFLFFLMRRPAQPTRGALPACRAPCFRRVLRPRICLSLVFVSPRSPTPSCLCADARCVAHLGWRRPRLPLTPPPPPS